jgi:hypothetical protein
MARRLLALFAIFVLVLSARWGLAMSNTKSAGHNQADFLTVQPNVAGKVGWYDGTTDSQGASGGWDFISATYGHHVAGGTCQGSDNKNQDNNLTITYTWASGDLVNVTLNARSSMISKTYLSSTQPKGGCPNGPPTWTGTGTVTGYIPGVGSSGTGTSGAFTVNLGQSGPGADGPPVGMSPVEWTVNPLDTGTHTKQIVAKVNASLNGTGVEIDVLKDEQKADFKLESKATPHAP